MDPINTTINIVKNNKPTLIRKVIIAVGAAAGMLITSTLVDRLGDRRPSLGELTLNDDTTVEPTETPDTTE